MDIYYTCMCHFYFLLFEFLNKMLFIFIHNFTLSSKSIFQNAHWFYFMREKEQRRKRYMWLKNQKENPATAKLLQSCPTLWDPIDGSLPGSSVLGILQAGTLEWVAISFSNAWKWKVKEKSLSHVWLFATPWTAAYQAPLSMGVSKQEYWSGVPLPSPNENPSFTFITMWPLLSVHTLMC